MNHRNAFGVTVAFALVGALLVHCSEDAPGATPVAPAAGPDEDRSFLDAAREAATTNVPGLCAKVGGATVVATISDAIMTTAAADCRIGVYFSTLTAESATHAKECMRRQLGEIFACPDSTYAGFTSSTGRACRSMADAHAGLVGADGKPGLNGNDYLAYVQAAQSAMRSNGVTDADVALVISIFNAEQPAVAPRVSPRNTHCVCPGGAFQGESCVPDAGRLDGSADAPAESSAPDASDASDASETG